MSLLRTASKVLMAPPILTLLYDLINGWFVRAEIKIRSFQDWWIFLDKASFEAVKPQMIKILSVKAVELLMKWPAPLTLLIPPVTLYILYRIIFALKGGHGAGYIYRSHD